MFRDKEKNLQRLEKELLAEEIDKKLPIWEQENWDPEDGETDLPAEDAPEEAELLPEEEVPVGKKKMSRLMKLSITALCLLVGILLVVLYWLIRFF